MSGRCDISGDADRTRGDIAPDVVGALGEFGLIGRVIGRLRMAEGVVIGPGDDAAVVLAPDGRVVASTDLLVEGRHFRRDWSSGYDVGRRAAAANFADIAAMGARPTALLVGLGSPPELSVEWTDSFTDGLADEATVVGASVVGGDVVRSDVVIVAGTALGDLEGRAPVTRAGARIGDVVVAAGRLGWAGAGLRLLRNGVEHGDLPDALRRPVPAYPAGPALAALGATSMLDVSDGLAADLGHVASASEVRIDVDLDALRTLGTDGVTDDDLLSGGDDHTLVATVPPGLALPDGVVVIGVVSAGAGVYVAGSRIFGGHDHFGGS